MHLGLLDMKPYSPLYIPNLPFIFQFSFPADSPLSLNPKPPAINPKFPSSLHLSAFILQYWDNTIVLASYTSPLCEDSQIVLGFGFWGLGFWSSGFKGIQDLRPRG